MTLTTGPMAADLDALEKLAKACLLDGDRAKSRKFRQTAHPSAVLALIALARRAVCGAGQCFECGHELHAPFCPVCNPEMVSRAVGGSGATDHTANPGDRAREKLDLIEVLRGDESVALTLFCDNPDFNGQPNSAVEINAAWTSWVTERFTGDTLLDALRSAHAAMETARKGASYG